MALHFRTYRPNKVQRLLDRLGRLLLLLAVVALLFSWGGTWAFNASGGEALWEIMTGFLGLYVAVACLTAGIMLLAIKRPSLPRVGLTLLSGLMIWAVTSSGLGTLHAARLSMRHYEAGLHDLAQNRVSGRLPPAEVDLLLEAVRRQGPFDLQPPVSWWAMACDELDPFSPTGLFSGWQASPDRPLSRTSWTRAG